MVARLIAWVCDSPVFWGGMLIILVGAAVLLIVVGGACDEDEPWRTVGGK